MEYIKRVELSVADLVPFGQKGLREFYALSLKRPIKQGSSDQFVWGDNWKAGQFVMIKPMDFGSEMTWARPFSICRITSQNLVLFFQVVGRGTRKLAKLKIDDKVLVWGPLGTSFAKENCPTLLLAGGIGIAPFAGYLEQHQKPNNLSMIFSHRLPIQYYPTENFSQQINFESFHEQSHNDLLFTIEKIKKAMLEIKNQNGLVLTCGPMPFLKFVWQFALEHDIRTQLSLEQKMACGVGACLGCVATTSANYPNAEKAGLPVQTCTRGPVFWANELDLNAGGM